MSMSQFSSLDNIIARYRNAKWNLKVPDHLKCLICKLLLLSPVQTGCGCRYCKVCLDEYLRNCPKTCLGDSGDCNVTISTYIIDRATSRDIGLLTVACPNSPCQQEDRLKNMGDHLGTCRYRRVLCGLCAMEYIEAEEKAHMANECPRREVDCPHCRRRLSHQELTESHFTVTTEGFCPKFVGKCPNKCDVHEDVVVADHLSICKNKPVRCPFHVLGCQERIPLDSVTDHVTVHSSLVAAEIRSLTDSMTDMKRKISELEKDNETLKRSMESLRDNYEKRYLEIERTQKQSSSGFPGRTETVYRRGKYIWKISNFGQLKDNGSKGINVSVMSSPFYTDEFGYKMSLKIYPFGDGIGKSTHLSVFFVLMRGEYDDLQVWPFRNKVTLTVLDDAAKSNHHSDTFKPDARSVCYQRPEDEYNIASGSPKFISFVDLNRFLKNDTLYLQINVLPL